MLGKNIGFPALPLLMYFPCTFAAVLENPIFFRKPSEYWDRFIGAIKQPRGTLPQGCILDT